MKYTWEYALVVCSLLMAVSSGAKADSLATLTSRLVQVRAEAPLLSAIFRLRRMVLGVLEPIVRLHLRTPAVLIGRVCRYIPLFRAPWPFLRTCNNPLLSFSSTLFESNACGFNAQTRSLTLSFSGVGFVLTDFGPKFYAGIPVGTAFLPDLGASGWGANEQFDAAVAGTSGRSQGPW